MSIYSKRAGRADYVDTKGLMSATRNNQEIPFGTIKKFQASNGSINVEVWTGKTGEAKVLLEKFVLKLKDLDSFVFSSIRSEAGAVPVSALVEGVSHTVDFPIAWTGAESEADIHYSISGNIGSIGITGYNQADDYGWEFRGNGHGELIEYVHDGG